MSDAISSLPHTPIRSAVQINPHMGFGGKMAKNNNKNTAPAKKASAAVKTPEVKRIDATKIFLTVFAIVALVGIVAAIVFGIISANSKKRIDYTKANLKKYITISADEYKDFDVVLNLDRLVDENGNDTATLIQSIQSAIYKLQYDNRKATDGKNKTGETVKVGDTANIYYYGYTLDAEGNKVPFSGGSNFSSSTTALGIGSGNFIPGFEAALVGKNMNDYRTMTKRTTGVVNDGNLITITYTVVRFENGSAEMNQTATIDLSEDVDAIWGQGFKAFLLGATVGEKIDGYLTVDRVGDDGVTRSDVYSDVKVTDVVEFSEGETLTIDVTFPRPYSSAELEGKSVKFDVYIESTVLYNTPAFDETFITETLKVTADDLADYEGQNIVEKYTAKIREDLLKSHEDSVNAAIEEAMWAHFLEVVVVKTKLGGEKKLPEAEVKYFYAQQMSEINSYYETYSSYYTKFADAACDYLQLAKGSDWQAELQKYAEQSVVEKLIFYYIARTENLMPDSATADRLYNEMLDEMTQAYLEQAGVNKTDYTEEEYAEKEEYYRDLVLTNYGSAYITESVLYEYVIETMRGYANSVEYAA